MAKKLFVGGLSWDTTSDKLAEYFAKIGPVLSANVITDKYSGKSKGFGFVEMQNDEDADKAKQELNGQEFDGRKIAVDEARPMQPRENNFSGGGNFRRDNRGGGGRDDRRGGGRDRDRRGGRR